jgi:hypothetical protein
MAKKPVVKKPVPKPKTKPKGPPKDRPLTKAEKANHKKYTKTSGSSGGRLP